MAPESRSSCLDVSEDGAAAEAERAHRANFLSELARNAVINVAMLLTKATPLSLSDAERFSRACCRPWPLFQGVIFGVHCIVSLTERALPLSKSCQTLKLVAPARKAMRLPSPMLFLLMRNQHRTRRYPACLRRFPSVHGQIGRAS